jgi:phosphatidylglycerophosphate synthase
MIITKTKVLHSIPIGLIYARLGFGFIIIALSYFQISWFRGIIVTLIILGIISDIFDGIIARKLQISSLKLRRMDSLIDQIFWICTLGAAFIICKEFFVREYVKLIIILSIEGLTYVASYIKFKKEVATHAIFSKIWTLTIMATLIEIILSCNSGLLFSICFYVGVLSRLEIIAILITLKQWCNDVPSLYHAFLLRQGKEITRNKLFNG